MQARDRPKQKHSLKMRFKRALVVIRQKVPPGLRLLAGIVLICLGFLGALPILGFWMIPLGIAVAMLDIAPIWRWFKRR